MGAAETSVGRVRDHNEDAHYIDPDAGIFIVCDGMGGHAAGEVASALAVQTIRTKWSSAELAKAVDKWLATGTPETRRLLMQTLQQGVVAAHDAIVAEAERDRGKAGMGTTLVGAFVVGGDVVFAHCGDSRAYLVRDGIAMQLTEDHTLLARLLAAGVDVDVEGEGMRFKSMLTNALGIGQEIKVSTFVVPVADGDRFLLCSDGITEYVNEAEIGEVLSKAPSPARSAQKLVDMALERGGGDNATALVIRVLEAGDTPRPSEHAQREATAIHACPLWAKVNPQQRLRALRIALPRDYPATERIPAQTLGDRVAWIIVEGEVQQEGFIRGPGALLYPEALLTDRPLPDKHGLAVAQVDVRLLALRNDDFRELCDDDPELGEVLLAALGDEIASRRPHRPTGKMVVQGDAEPRGSTDPGAEATPPAGLPQLPDLPPIPPRARTNTDLGTAAPERAQASAPRAATDPGRASSPRLHARGSTPPLIAPATEVGDDLDRALDEATGERGPHKHVAPRTSLAPADDEDAEIVVEPRADDAAAAAAEAAAATDIGRGPTAPYPAVESAKRPANMSEPEISIEQLEDAADAEDEAAPVVEVLKDTSSQKITMTAEPSEPEIVIEPHVAADSGPSAAPRPKRTSDGWD